MTELRFKINPELKEAFKALAEAESVKPEEMITKLMDTYQQVQSLQAQLKACQDAKGLELSMLEQAEVDAAIEVSGKSEAELLKEGLLQRSKYINSTMGKDFSEMKAEERKSSTAKGLAEWRVSQIIDKLKAYNSDSSDKVALTKSVINKFGISINQGAIVAFFSKHQASIDEYHNAEGIDAKKANYKGKGFDWGKLIDITDIA